MYTTFKTKDIVKYKQIYNDYEVEKVPCNLEVGINIILNALSANMNA